MLVAGWTPLHLAALVSTPPLISFLLTRGASPHAVTNRGLTPLDLVSGMHDRAEVASLLEHATSVGCSRSSTPNPQLPEHSSLSVRRQAMLQRRRHILTKKFEKREEEARMKQIAVERERWLTERAKAVEVDAELLLPPPKKRADWRSNGSAIGCHGDEKDAEDDMGDESEAEDEGIGDPNVSVHPPCCFLEAHRNLARRSLRFHACLQHCSAAVHTRYPHHLVSTALLTLISEKSTRECALPLCSFRSPSVR